MSGAERATFIAAVDERTREKTLAAPVEIDADGQVRSFGG
jgi:hypothetical protein